MRRVYRKPRDETLGRIRKRQPRKSIGPNGGEAEEEVGMSAKSDGVAGFTLIFP